MEEHKQQERKRYSGLDLYEGKGRRRTEPFEKVMKSYLIKGSRTVLGVCRQRMIGGETSGKEKAMKNVKRLMALIIAAMITTAINVVAFAETSTPSITIVPKNVEGEIQSLAIDYTYYQILEASIGEDPTVAADGAGTNGTAAYYVTTQARVDELSKTDLFNISKVDGQDKWYVELKNKEHTSAQNLIDAFEAATFNLSVFPTGTFNKTADETQAESGTLPAGYYYITSSLGTKAAVQTLTAVTINEKNTYPSIAKADEKEYVAIDDTINYTVTVVIPESVDEKPITIYDTITNGLTLNTAVTVSGAVDNPVYTSATFVQDSTIGATAAQGTAGEEGYVPATKAATVYKIEIPAATVLANKGQTLTFTYTAKLNENAVVLELEHNKAHLVYDNYTTVDVDTDVTTLAFDIQKVDGTDKTTILAGAEFRLYDAATDGNEIKVVLKEAASAANGQINIYRVAKENETGVAIAAGTARIEGLANKAYYLDETKAPTGYNKLESRFHAEASATASTTEIDYKIENNKGSVLPSTGGIGTTIFYIVGAILVVIAGVLLVTRRRMKDE